MIKIEKTGTELLTRAEVAEMLHVSPKTLANWYSAGIGPECRRVGRQALYLKASVESYITDLFEQEAA